MNTSVSPHSPSPTHPVLSGFRVALVGAGVVLGVWFFAQETFDRAALFAIGLGMGAVLYYGAFGFSAAYRRAIVNRDMAGVLAQVLMIGLASILFAPILSQGQAAGAWAPVGLQVGIGAFVFGIGMQLGGACASGTLFSIGGGSIRMILTLTFFCIGAFIGSLHLGWWSTLPEWGTKTLGHSFGWGPGLALHLGILALVFAGLKYFGKNHSQTKLWNHKIGLKNLLMGPWPLMLCAFTLALLNFATLLTADHPWSITWAFGLWAAKGATLLGWDASTSGFWSAPFQSNALHSPVLDDTTSLMNISIICGAFAAAFLSMRMKVNVSYTPKALIAAVIGGLMMGYGARLAYGCNIGALFSGLASTSLHGWLWLVCAIPGTWIGIKLRPLFGLGR